VPVMLVSNYQEAQQQAVGAGAVPGFGKDSLGRPSMIALLKPFLEQADESRASALEPKSD